MFTIQNLLDDAKCYEQVRAMRWPDRVYCPHCQSSLINKRGFHNTERYRQRYQCQNCEKQFDDLTQTIFEGHHQPLKVWLICLYLMGLNLSNQQIAQELALNKDDVQEMTRQLRQGIVVKKRSLFWKVKPNLMRSI